MMGPMPALVLTNCHVFDGTVTRPDQALWLDDGVIRAVGLSNDGRGRGLLAPAEEGQERAMRQAYAASGLAPSDISLLECHATGTVVGDATEVHSATAVFAGTSGVPIGSLKVGRS